MLFTFITVLLLIPGLFCLLTDGTTTALIVAYGVMLMFFGPSLLVLLVMDDRQDRERTITALVITTVAILACYFLPFGVNVFN